MRSQDATAAQRPRRASIDAVVVGAGQAGITLSHYLQQRGIQHVVLERDRPFSAWERRWEGFTTNTPNWMNTLPMMPEDQFPSDDPDAFATKEELLDYLHNCLESVGPPIEIGCNVDRVTQMGADGWEVRTRDMIYEASAVAICNGAMSHPQLPESATAIEGLSPQLHSSDYRTPSQIETSRVLIVGSASSGVQICRLLGESGRFSELHMAVSDVMTLPRRILGVQTHRFLHAFRLFDVEARSWLGRLMYSGLETKGDPIMRPNPKDLNKLFGVELHGRFAGAEGSSIIFENGDSMDVDDLTVIWCTGFRGDYGMIRVERPSDVFDDNGFPNHFRGVVGQAPGLYFVGLRYQHTVASHDLYGVGADAEHVADRLADHLQAWPAVRDKEVAR